MLNINTNQIHRMAFLQIPIQLLIIGFFVFRQKIVDNFREPFKEKFTMCATDMKFKIGNMWKTLLTPIVVTVILYVAWVLFFKHFFNGFPHFPINDPLITLDFVTLAPIAEQILQGFLLSAFFLYSNFYYKNKWEVGIICLFGLLLSAILITSIHENPYPIYWLIRFSSFIIYGTLYYLNERNLLPAIVAHSAWNIILLNQTQ